ncbi:mandelate racemase/muconate lactonizing enzyme family protein [Sodalis sp. RH22]|uniref:mandelate racemase/muconate lactonizing enzyme family protein n=1 Tax=unclassified Sodalis (in: enterobacteria) TaxID=2636512 RepID=UPI0039B38E10
MSKIKSIEIYPVRLPLKQAMKLASEKIESTVNVFIRVLSSDNHHGWGEASIAATMTGEYLVDVLFALDYSLIPHLIGEDTDNFTAIEYKIDRLIAGATTAKSALCMAIADLVARQKDIPLWQLLGNKRRDSIPALKILSGSGQSQDDATLTDAIRAGYRYFKIKVGIDDPLEDAERICAIRATHGDKIALSADANMAWDVDKALQFMRHASPAGLQYLEQPLKPADDDGLKMLLAHSSLMDIAADESLHTDADILRERHLGVMWFNLKLLKFGTYNHILAGVLNCDSTNGNVVLACKIAESSVASSAMAHLAATVSRLNTGVSFTQDYLSQDVTSAPLSVRGGMVNISDTPGHGVEVNLDIIKSLQLKI